ncbi:MAG: DUF3504 domain-containing protein [Sedimenticola sp.]
MASNSDFSVNDKVSIDGKGAGVVTEVVFRGFSTFYNVKLVDSDFEVELESKRLAILPEDVPERPSVRQQSVRSNANQRFSMVSDTDVDNFNYQQTNKNTLTKTVHDLKILRAYLDEPEINESRQIEEIPANELSSLLSRFIISVKKQNGDEYEPSCLKGMLGSFDRQLRRKEYGESIATGAAFSKVRDTLAKKQRQLKSEGKGNLPNKTDPLTDEDVEQLWNSDQLGAATPDSILQTLWLYNTVHFGLRSCQEHRDMRWGDISLKTDDSGQEYLQFSERYWRETNGVTAFEFMCTHHIY